MLLSKLAQKKTYLKLIKKNWMWFGISVGTKNID